MLLAAEYIQHTLVGCRVYSTYSGWLQSIFNILWLAVGQPTTNSSGSARRGHRILSWVGTGEVKNFFSAPPYMGECYFLTQWTNPVAAPGRAALLALVRGGLIIQHFPKN